MEDIKPFQIIGAYELFNRKRALLADEMGMYKTSQSIFADSLMREKEGNSDFKTLVIAPSSVREHWAREIKKWAPHYNPKIQILDTSNFYQGLENAIKSDWVIGGYSLMSSIAKENGRADQLKDLNFQHLILDEVHNAKNPSALRTTTVKRIADQTEYLSALSGTPIPNSIVDLYMLFSLLEPNNYPVNLEDPKEIKSVKSKFLYLYKNDPEAVKRILHERMIRRETKDYIQENLPEVREQDIIVPLSGDNADVYYSVLEQETSFGSKLMQLEKASLDPSLVDPRFIENPSLRNNFKKIESLKYQALDSIINDEIGNNGKVVVFTNLKTGVVDKLYDRYKEYGVLVIDGDVSSDSKKGLESEREIRRKLFQFDPDYKILIATTTMNEGVDLTAATGIVHLGIPWTPAELSQRNRRSLRNGEIKKDRLNIYNLVTKVEDVESIEEAILGLNRNKETRFRYMTSGITLSKKDLEDFQEAKKTRKIKESTKSIDQKLVSHFIRFRGQGKDKVSRFLKRDPESAQSVAELYPKFKMSKNASNIYLGIIEELEKENPLEVKLDLACGIGALGISLNEPVISLDIDPFMLHKGKELYKENKLVRSPMDTLPIKDKSIDLIVCSLAYQMVNPENNERENVLIEINRTLRKNGKSIILLNSSYLDENDNDRFSFAAKKLGFNIMGEYSGIMQSEKSKFGVYTLDKVDDVNDTILDSNLLKFFGDYTKNDLRKKIREK